MSLEVASLRWLKSVLTRSLRRQLILGIVLIHAVLMTLFGFDLVERQREFLLGQSREQARSLAETLAANSVSWVLANDVAGLLEIVHSQMRYPRLRYAMLLSPQGRVLAHSDRQLTGLYVNDAPSLAILGARWQSLTVVDDGRVIDMAEPIVVNQRLIGWARVGLGHEHITASLARVTGKGLSYVALAIVVGVLFAWLMASRLTSSLREFARVAVDVREGHTDRRVRLGRHDELGVLAVSFNRMLDTLHDQARARDEAQRQLARNQAEFEAMFRAIPDAVIFTDNERRIAMVNPSTFKLFGHRRRELLGKTTEHLYASRQLYEEAGMDLEPADGAGLAQPYLETRFRRRDGSEFIGQALRAPVADTDDRQLGYIALIRDISQTKQAEMELRRAAQVFENSSEGILITDADGRIVMANQAFMDITGYSDAEVIGQTPHLLSSGRHPPEFFRYFWQCLERYGWWRGEIWNRRKNGEVYPEWLAVSAVRDDAGTIVNYVGMFSDISERWAAAERIEHLANHDALTDLPNRLLLHDRIRQAIARAQRHPGLVAVLFIDLDRFKNINDSLGHHAGDELLVGVAARLLASVREEDTVSRLGGDEFVVLLAGLEDPGASGHVAQKVLDAMKEPFRLQQHDIIISPSIGISLYPSDGSDSDILIKNADAAMYHAKSLGRNNYQYYTAELNAQTLHRLAVESGLRRAMIADELVLHYQPQVGYHDHGIVGLEALIRWRHPEKGLVMPGDFISIAEDSGLIVELGEWVLREACRQNKAWQDAGYAKLPVAVNISALQFHHRHFYTVLERALQESGLDPRFLELELTESALMQDADSKLDMLHAIKRLGIQLSLDDFGTGYSSLSYLKRFPIDKLKIDKSFVRDITTNPEDEAIVSAIIVMAKRLRLRTIAEGVETQEQYHRLEELGCDELQGHVYCHPLPADALTDLLRPPLRSRAAMRSC